MDCDNSMCSGTRKGLFSIQKEFTCAICHELFVRAHTLSCSHSYCERCISSWLKKHQDCPTCRKRIEGKPVHSIALDNAVGKLVELRVENFAERLKRKNTGASVAGVTSRPHSVTKQSDCGTQTSPNQSRDLNKNYNDGAFVRHFFRPRNGGHWNEFHFYGVPCHGHDDYSDDDDDDYDDYDDDDYDDSVDDNYDDYNGLPGCYWGGYGTCFNCGDPFHWANGCPRW